MKNLLLFIILCIAFFDSSLARPFQQKGLERLNFFPDADAFLTAQYQYSTLNIETPKGSIDTKEVNNYYNILSLGYARRLNRSIFLGIRSSFEQASENAVSYGIPLARRFNGSGLREIEVFSLYRLRFQKGERGLIDLFLSYSPNLGDREVGGNNSKRFNGQDIFRINLSHGLWEEEWEFKTALNFEYYGEGVEQNKFQDAGFIQESYFNFKLQFNTQYRIQPRIYVYSGIGFNYTSERTIHENGLPKRELQLGTGSILEAGLKKSLSNWSLIDLSYALNRYEYFVKGESDNLDGDAIRQRFTLNYKLAF